MREREVGRDRERGRETLKQAPLAVRSLIQGLIPWSARSWPESKSKVGCLTEPPRRPNIAFFKRGIHYHQWDFLPNHWYLFCKFRYWYLLDFSRRYKWKLLRQNLDFSSFLKWFLNGLWTEMSRSGIFSHTIGVNHYSCVWNSIYVMIIAHLLALVTDFDFRFSDFSLITCVSWNPWRTVVVYKF